MVNPKPQTKNQKKAAQNVMAQLAAEPLEILRTAKESLTNQPPAPIPPTMQPPNPSQEPTSTEASPKDMRTLQALETEIKDMSAQRLLEDMARKIDDGQDVFIENITGLSDAQKDILRQRREMYLQQQKLQSAPKQALPQTSKRSRRFGANKKDVAKREETRVEKPTPTSG